MQIETKMTQTPLYKSKVSITLEAHRFAIFFNHMSYTICPTQLVYIPSLKHIHFVLLQEIKIQLI